MGTVPALPVDSEGDPTLLAGQVATSPQMNQLVTCCSFLLNKPIAHVSLTGGQSITATSGPGTAINWDVKDYDPDGMWSNANPARLTVQTPGFYKVRYGFGAGSGTSVMNGAVWGTTGPNNPSGSGLGIGTVGYWGSYCAGFATTNAAGSSGVFPYYLYAGDYLQVKVYASASWSLPTGTPNVNFFSAEWVST